MRCRALVPHCGATKRCGFTRRAALSIREARTCARAFPAPALVNTRGKERTNEKLRVLRVYVHTLAPRLVRFARKILSGYISPPFHPSRRCPLHFSFFFRRDFSRALPRCVLLRSSSSSSSRRLLVRDSRSPTRCSACALAKRSLPVGRCGARRVPLTSLRLPARRRKTEPRRDSRDGDDCIRMKGTHCSHYQDGWRYDRAARFSIPLVFLPQIIVDDCRRIKIEIEHYSMSNFSYVKFIYYFLFIFFLNPLLICAFCK